MIRVVMSVALYALILFGYIAVLEFVMGVPLGEIEEQRNRAQAVTVLVIAMAITVGFLEIHDRRSFRTDLLDAILGRTY